MSRGLWDTWPANSDWTTELQDILFSAELRELDTAVTQERRVATVFPAPGDTFSAFAFTPWSEVKVVILGQDPYHGPGQAHGLSFSVREGVPLPPTLKNIYRELAEDLQCPVPSQGDLRSWAAQGVFLLNSILTVRQGEPLSHRDLGWEWFTDRVIERLGQRSNPTVFILWGAPAQKKRELLREASHHLVLAAPHPSPLSAYRGFWGSRPFSQANRFLRQAGRQPIVWSSVCGSEPLRDER